MRTGRTPQPSWWRRRLAAVALAGVLVVGIMALSAALEAALAPKAGHGLVHLGGGVVLGALAAWILLHRSPHEARHGRLGDLGAHLAFAGLFLFSAAQLIEVAGVAVGDENGDGALHEVAVALSTGVGLPVLGVGLLAWGAQASWRRLRGRGPGRSGAGT